MVTRHDAVSKKGNKKISESGPKLQDYELVLIFNPEVEEDKRKKIIDDISQLLTKKGGTIESEDHWGKRKLSYPLKHHLEGNYVLLRLKMQAEWGKELEAGLHITEEVLRHLLLRVK